MRRQGSPDHALEAVFSPRAIAIVGASDDPAKWGHILARRALSSRGDAHRAAREPPCRRGPRRARLPLRAGRRRDARPEGRPGCAVRAGRGLRGLGGRRRRRRRPGRRGHHRGTLRGGSRGRPARGRGAGDRPRRGRGAGRSQLPRGRRHDDRAPAGPRRAPARGRGRAQPERQPGAGPRRVAGRPRTWACPGSSRSATRPISGSSTSCTSASTTRRRGRWPSTPRTSSTGAPSSTPRGRCATPASRWSCSRPAAPRPPCAARLPTPAR